MGALVVAPRVSTEENDVVTVAEAITGGRGKVRVGDSVWQAEGPDMPAGTAARITGSSGTVLRIEPAKG